MRVKDASEEMRKKSNRKSIRYVRDVDGWWWQTQPTGRLHRKKNIKDFRRQPTLCMWNLEVRDRRLRLHRLALPSPAEIISTRADGTSIAASHGYANGTRGRGMVVSQLRWQSKRARIRQRMDLSITNEKPILWFRVFYFAYGARV